MRNVTGRNVPAELRTWAFGRVALGPSFESDEPNDLTLAHGLIPFGWATDSETRERSVASRLWPQDEGEAHGAHVLLRGLENDLLHQHRGVLVSSSPYSSITSTRNETGRKPSLQQSIAVPGFAT